MKSPLRIDFTGGWTDIPYLIKGFGGYVSNVAISPLVLLKNGELDMGYYPRGTGLSTSTAVKIMEMIKDKGKKDYLKSKNPSQIAEDLFILENKDLNWAIGRQDMYSIANGGFNCFRFGQDGAQTVPMAISKETLEQLEKRLLLFYVGLSRLAQTIVEQVYRNFNSGNSVAKKALTKIGKLGLEFSQKLEKGDLDGAGVLISENWQAQKELVPACSSQTIDEIYDFAMRSGAIGGKMCGAGGGGSFVFYSLDPIKLGQELEKKFKEGRILPFSFEYRNIIEINSG